MYYTETSSLSLQIYTDCIITVSRQTEMTDILQIVVSLLTVAGFGGVLGAYFQARFQQRSKIGELEHELKQKRYLCILILMLTKLTPEAGLSKVRAIRPDLRSLDDVENELKTELLNAVVFAGQPVLQSLAGFIRSPTKTAFVAAASAMRKDLWGKRASVGPEFIELLPSPASGHNQNVG